MTFRSEPRVRGLLVALVVLATSAAAHAEPAEKSPENVSRARADYVAALDHVKQARWGEALASFERSAAARPHSLTTYNIGACERALGRYTRARASLLAALAMDDAAPKRELPASFAADAKKWVEEIDTLLVRANMKLEPADAQVLVDGSPLVSDPARPEVLVAGLPAAGATATRAPGAKFVVELDPGTHLFSLSRPGFTNAIVPKTFAPGARADVELDLQSLPAVVEISANQKTATVFVDGLDVGTAPVKLTRPAGSYQIAVRKEGFVPYATKVVVGPGDHPALNATLTRETSPITKSPWFWGAAVAIVAGAAAATYLVARPAPERPQPDGGGLGWTVDLAPR